MFLHGREDETTSTTSNASSDAEYDNLQIYNMDSMKLLDVLDIPIRLVSFNPLAMKNYWGNKAMLDANRMTLEDYQRIDMHAMTSPQVSFSASSLHCHHTGTSAVVAQCQQRVWL